jgi:hypothetical protein
MSFAVKPTNASPKDMVGQVQPGYFASPAELAAYFVEDPFYLTLTRMSDWKPMGPPQFSNLARQAEQKLLVRRDEGKDWEELYLNFQLQEVVELKSANVFEEGDEGALAKEKETKSEIKKKRWLIASIYKRDAGRPGIHVRKDPTEVDLLPDSIEGALPDLEF